MSHLSALKNLAMGLAAANVAAPGFRDQQLREEASRQIPLLRAENLMESRPNNGVDLPPFNKLDLFLTIADMLKPRSRWPAISKDHNTPDTEFNVLHRVFNSEVLPRYLRSHFHFTDSEHAMLLDALIPPAHEMVSRGELFKIQIHSWPDEAGPKPLDYIQGYSVELTELGRYIFAAATNSQ